MLEMLIHPSQTQKRSWKMLFVGLLYGSLSLLLVHWFFSNDVALKDASGMIVIVFCIMFSLPYMYFLIKEEEEQDESVEGLLSVWKAHSDALYAFMWLFLGFIISFSFWFIVLQNPNLFNFQIKTFCAINNPGNLDECISQFDFTSKIAGTGGMTKVDRFMAILENNVYVMIFTLIFSLVFGAGVIFILAWNASVIAAAIGIFSKYQIQNIPVGIGRYMILRSPEIAAYFITALAGGIFGIGVIRNGFRNAKFLRVIENVVILLFIAMIILAIAAVIEVYLTPAIFN